MSNRTAAIPERSGRWATGTGPSGSAGFQSGMNRRLSRGSRGSSRSLLGVAAHQNRQPGIRSLEPARNSAGVPALARAETNPNMAVLGVENRWFVGNKQVMREIVWIKVHPAASESRSIDVELTWRPTDQSITLWGAEGKSYGGLTLRFGPRSKTIITVPTGRTSEDLVETKLPWADLSGDLNRNAAGLSGAAVFVHPEHPEASGRESSSFSSSKMGNSRTRTRTRKRTIRFAPATKTLRYQCKECKEFSGLWARIAPLNWDWLVAQAFQPAGSGDFRVASIWPTGLESPPVNRQAGKPALHSGSWAESG